MSECDRTDGPATPDPRARRARARFESDPPQAMTDADSDRLDMIARGVRSLSFPTDRETLVAAAREAGESELAVELRSLPQGARYPDLDALLLAMGVGTAGRIDVPDAPRHEPAGGAQT